jgi:hypothetical protein
VKLNGAVVTDYDGVAPVPPHGKYEPDRGPWPDTGYIQYRMTAVRKSYGSGTSCSAGDALGRKSRILARPALRCSSSDLPYAGR